jgi:signal transduction histidine kinase
LANNQCDHAHKYSERGKLVFRSIRWRLVASYVLLTLITVILVGLIAQWAVKTYARTQARESLAANAENIARQVQPLMGTRTSLSELSQLSQAASAFGNVRVRILDQRLNTIVDTGTPGDDNELMWFVFPGEHTGLLSDPSPFGWVIPQALLPTLDEQRLQVFEQLPFDTPVTIIRRVERPWGDHLSFETTYWQGRLPRLEIEQPITQPRSTEIVTVPIGPANRPAGFVELSEALNLGDETLATTQRALLLAGAAAVLLAGILGMLMGKRITDPITELTERTRRMSDGDLSVRAPVRGRDEIGKLADQFNQMAEQLGDTFNQLATERDTLRRFIADASHELRTPITALKNFNELLQGAAADDQKARTEFLTESEVQLDRLSWITQNLLDLSRLDAELVQLDLADHDIGSIIESTASLYQSAASEHDLTLKVHLPDPPLSLSCDRTRLEMALSNLLDNAIKFTSAGDNIEIGAERQNNATHLWVQDNGVGIHPEDLPHVFERFYRGRESDAEGYGLGLSIVQSIVNAHGASIEVDSSPGEGARFTIVWST